jgi:sugar transferase (PEP-CTERM/EpsH1 system associated)
MSARREVLYLAHRIPYPPDKGDKIRSWRFAQHLARSFDVHIAAFVDEPADFAHKARLEAAFASVSLVALDPRAARFRSLGSLASGEPLTFGYYDDAAMREIVRTLQKRPLAAEVAFSSSMAQYLSRPGLRPRIADLCDADSDKWRDYAATANPLMRWVYAREHRRLAAAETRIINGADAAIAISTAEAALLAGRPGVARPVLVAGNGVDADYFSPGRDYAAPRDAADVVFVGAMDYKPNADAAAWFAAEVWPAVRAASPRATFAVIGPRPAPALARLSGVDGVAVTGRVDDVRPYLRSAKAVVAPLRIARGVQNKVLEAMAMAKPVVATQAANTGIEAAGGREILIADAASQFADCVKALLADQERGRMIGLAARERILAEFAWERGLAQFDAALRAAGVAA